MDRNTYLHFVALPFSYYSVLSVGLILCCSYLLVTTGRSSSFAREDTLLNHEEVNLSKDIDKNIEVIEVQSNDIRIKKIDAYFANKKSPLVGYGSAFVKEADKNQIDWRLLPAIAMIESTGGKSITAQANYNPFGWGFNDNKANNNPDVYQKNSWEHSIASVSKGIRNSYYDAGLIEVSQIVTKYNPGSVSRANGVPEEATWTKNILFVINEINNINV